MEHIYWGIEGWFTREQEELYVKAINLAPKEGAHFVEVGAWKGRSTTAMAVYIINSGKNIKFDVIDTFKGSEEHENYKSIKEGTLYQEYQNNIKPVEHVINTIVGDSSHVASFYADESLDFIFLDGDHTREGVIKDITAWLPKLKPGGIIAGDDFASYHQGVIDGVTACISDVILDGVVWIYAKPKEIRNVPVKSEHYNPNYNFSKEVEKAYIISVPDKDGHVSAQLERCIETCQLVGMDYEVFDAFDGTDNESLIVPEHMKDKSYLSWFKMTDHGMTTREMGCALSHISLWAHCVTIDKPIVILEHDAIMLKKYTHIPSLNVVDYLGNSEIAHETIQTKNIVNGINGLIEWLRDHNIVANPHFLSPLGATSDNFFYMLGAHAYAICPLVARKLLARVMVDGIQNPNDTMISLRETSLISSGLYATEGPDAFTKSSILPVLVNVNDMEEVDKKYRTRKDTFIIPGYSK